MDIDDEVLPTTATSALPTRQASRRKRTAKSIGPDFVTDYYPGSSRSTVAISNNNLSNTAAYRRALRLSARHERLKLRGEIDKPETTPERDADNTPVCAECHLASGNFPAYSSTERRFIRCSNPECPYTAHAGCTGICGSGEPETTFRCEDCKICAVCQSGKTRKNSRLIQCLNCFQVYHLGCHSPPVDPESVENWGTRMSSLPGWQCSACTKAGGDEGKLNNLSTTEAHILEPESQSSQIDEEYADDQDSSRAPSVEIMTPTALAVQKNMGEEVRSQRPVIVRSSNRLRPLDRTIEGITNEERELRQDLAMWSVEQCAAYFIDSQPELADLISRHELLGSSLMLISRAQFAKLFGLSIGKNLKMFGAICKWRKITF
ncbi:uncharacterized protein LOC129580799 [Paramacrobiotus metropolitanus]|uniref:uncharacterized protein LOC129580799 n=1 Tax=Paramacrobiotus metropolitanus TaxID=2943436 RepID=UPI002445691C|nr:uncharacterized protein LOC129580799 [Paramacrobiotus metropolitanus]XP_055327443.1 uncharacterized protein LOC129580799 [Paramacrobiotus metropolitanus]XP_055327444.1 uncharacterized protein LOC129580799 [Paramacrobiotus metropolitanus]XP_055327445.1 uncharacterized protein LOC129580799 [Paramacrobiotus metropolitanus]